MSLSDAQYGPNPLCSLHNWRVLAVHSLPRVRWLDGLAVDAAEVAAAESLWRKKSLYYTRCRQRVKRVASELQRVLAAHCQQAVAAVDGLRRLVWQLRCAVEEVRYVVAEEEGAALDGSGGGGGGSWRNALAECSTRVASCAALCNTAVSALLASHRSMSASVSSRQTALLRAMELELESGGNVRWDESEQLLHYAAAQLLASREQTDAGVSLQLVRVVQLRDAEYRIEALNKQADANRSRPNYGRQQPTMEDEQQAESAWFTEIASLTDSDTPLSTTSAVPHTCTIVHRSAYAALSAAASATAETINHTHSLLAVTLPHLQPTDRNQDQQLPSMEESKQQLTELRASPAPDSIAVTDVRSVVPQWLLSVRVCSVAGGSGCLSLLSSLPGAVLRLTSEFVGLRECAIDVCAAVSSCERMMDEQRLGLRDSASALMAVLPLSLLARCHTLHRTDSSNNNPAPPWSPPRGESAIDLTSGSSGDRLLACAGGFTDLTQVNGAVQWSQLLILVLSCNALTSLQLPTRMPLLRLLDVSHNQLTVDAFNAALFELVPALHTLQARHNRLHWADRDKTLRSLLDCLIPCTALRHIDWGAALVSAAYQGRLDSREPTAALRSDEPYCAYARRAVELFPALVSLDGLQLPRAAIGDSAQSEVTNSGVELFEWRVSLAAPDCLPVAPDYLTDDILRSRSVLPQSATVTVKDNTAAGSSSSSTTAGKATSEWPINVLALELDHLALTALTASRRRSQPAPGLLHTPPPAAQPLPATTISLAEWQPAAPHGAPLSRATAFPHSPQPRTQSADGAGQPPTLPSADETRRQR